MLAFSGPSTHQGRRRRDGGSGGSRPGCERSALISGAVGPDVGDNPAVACLTRLSAPPWRHRACKFRARFVELFCDDDLMVSSAGVLTTDAAHDRFDEMWIRGAELAFAKQPVVEQSTRMIVGCAGVNWFDFEGRRRLQFGYQLRSLSRTSSPMPAGAGSAGSRRADANSVSRGIGRECWAKLQKGLTCAWAVEEWLPAHALASSGGGVLGPLNSVPPDHIAIVVLASHRD
jgi:hypothetical protein